MPGRLCNWLLGKAEGPLLCNLRSAARTLQQLVINECDYRITSWDEEIHLNHIK